MPVDPGEAHTRFFAGDDPAREWSDIERLYREGVSDCGLPWLAPMLDLVVRVQRSGIGKSLRGQTGRYVLSCTMHERFGRFEPRLQIEPSPDQAYRLTFVHPNLPRKDDWTATYPADQLAPAVSRFLIRVGWVPEGHPAHEILAGA
jgi:hypothetical protein